MEFNKDSGKWWRRLGTACVIASVALAPWTCWGALALAGIGLAVAVPHWLRRVVGGAPGIYRPGSVAQTRYAADAGCGPSWACV